MSVTISPTGVIYQPDILEVRNVVDANASNATTTLATVSDLSLALGKGERAIVNYNIHYNISAATADLKYRVYTISTDPADAADTALTPVFLRIAGQSVEPSGTTATWVLTDTDTTTTVATTNTGNAFLRISTVVTNNASKTGNLIFQFAPAGTGTGIIYAGSYAEVRRF